MSSLSNEIEINNFIESIQLTESLEDKIYQRYTAIGSWLNRQNSPIKKYNPTIYPQGSVRTGTIIKPLGTGAYDVDLVCELKISSENISPYELKQLVGDEVTLYMKENGFKADIKESKKCWTIEYAENGNFSFHVDVLPALKKHINDDYKTDIYITNDTIDGPPGIYEDSNPKGFATWLKNQELQNFIEIEKRIKLNKKLEVIPEHKVPTPLRKAIMLLKRHRDTFYQFTNQQFKPTSVVITTLAAQFYSKNPLTKTEDTLKYICSELENYILSFKYTNFYVLKSPCSDENFLDKWNSDKKYAENFELWVRRLIEDADNIDVFLNSLKDCEQLSNEELILFLTNQKHAIKKYYQQLNPTINCFIKAENLSLNNKVIQHKEVVPKNIKIKFTVDANISSYEDYTVYWRVINTGLEAFRLKGLRGDMFCDKDNPKNSSREEHTGYSGIHSMEAFIVQNKKIIAKSLPFVIKIK